MNNIPHNEVNGVFIPASDYEKAHGTFVYASDFSHPDDFYYALDEMCRDMTSSELSLREVMDELYSLIADISNSCSNPMTESFELSRDKEDVINAYHKKLIIICCKLPEFLFKLYNVYQTMTTVHGELAWTFAGDMETIPAERYNDIKKLFKAKIKNAISPYDGGAWRNPPL